MRVSVINSRRNATRQFLVYSKLLVNLGSKMRSHYMLAIVALHIALQLPDGDASSGAVRCPCASDSATWEFSMEQAMHVSDVVMMGRIVSLREGLRGTMNATISSIITYKGRNSQFLTMVHHVTNFEKDSSREMALFFLAVEPAGNLALQCMSTLLALNSVSDLRILLDFVRDMGIGT